MMFNLLLLMEEQVLLVRVDSDVLHMIVVAYMCTNAQSSSTEITGEGNPGVFCYTDCTLSAISYRLVKKNYLLL